MPKIMDALRATQKTRAEDNVGVVGVQFKLDIANLGPEDSTNTYSLSWDTTAVTVAWPELGAGWAFMAASERVERDVSSAT